MGVYDRQIAQALRIIRAKGQIVTWNPSGITLDSTQPWKATEVAATSKQVSIVFVTPGGSLAALFRLITGTDVPTGAPAGLMGAVNFTPAINDSVARGSDNLV